jgi:hypothetical protein
VISCDAPAVNKHGMVVAALWIVGGCAGAAVAHQTIETHRQNAAAAEANDNLRALFMGAAAYYAAEHVSRGASASSTSCTVGPARSGNRPSATPGTADFRADAWMALNFAPDPVRCSYEIAAPPGSCGHPAPEAAVYSFRANGDDDGNGVTSLFEMTAATDENGNLFHAAELHVVNEAE